MPAFITELCEQLGVANKRRSATNFTQMVSEKGVPDNSYIMFTAVVKMSPQVWLLFYPFVLFVFSPAYLTAMFLLPLSFTTHSVASASVVLHTRRRLHRIHRKAKRRNRVSFEKKIGEEGERRGGGKEEGRKEDL
jgi:hypothetical protein